MTIPASWIISGISFILGIAVWLGKLSFERSLDKRDQRLEREEKRKEKEAEKQREDRQTEIRMIMRGLKTLTECQYEVVYQMQNGTHNGGLEECLNNITQYKKDVNQWFEDLATRR